MTPVNRRALLVNAAGAGFLAASGVVAGAPAVDAAQTLAAIEAETGGRVGVAALDTGSGAWLVHRPDQRFAMCSTFKVLLAGVVLNRIDRGLVAPEMVIRYTRADLMSHAPRAEAHLEDGGMSVTDLCAAAVETSDNTAATLLLALVGGPAAFTSSLRALGDPVTRLDRGEPALNSNLPGDPRDTTTPRAFVLILRRLLLGEVLSPQSRRTLADWMIACETGLGRLRAGAPAGWRAGDKTGTGSRGAVNDVAIFWPPGRAPILVAAMMSGSARSADALGVAQARIARVVAGAFG